MTVTIAFNAGAPTARTSRRNRALQLLCIALILACSWGGATGRAATLASQSAQQQDAARDGRHDFDFNFGVWHTHIRRVLDPFSASSETVELNGTVTVRKVWNGRASLEEIEADGPKGHWEGMTLFLYNPGAHQWSQWFANSAEGVMSNPLTGSFKDGRGELYSHDTFHNKSILVRGVWSAITADSHRYEESYSNDGGKTWAVAFTGELTRDTDPAPQIHAAATDRPQHDFDWDLGTWKIQMRRLQHPLTGSTTWTEMDGITVNSKVWDGRANLAEVETDGPNGHLELLALRLFNPATHEWNVNFATSGVGMLNTPTGLPTIGEFKNGVGEFYDQEPYEGRAILVRFRIWPISPGLAESEQAFSDDGGKTWEVNWINKYTRVKAD